MAIIAPSCASIVSVYTEGDIIGNTLPDYVYAPIPAPEPQFRPYEWQDWREGI